MLPFKSQNVCTILLRNIFVLFDYYQCPCNYAKEVKMKRHRINIDKHRLKKGCTCYCFTLYYTSTKQGEFGKKKVVPLMFLLLPTPTTVLKNCCNSQKTHFPASCKFSYIIITAFLLPKIFKWSVLCKCCGWFPLEMEMVRTIAEIVLTMKLCNKHEGLQQGMMHWWTWVFTTSPH